jgi:hypothetical protein
MKLNYQRICLKYGVAKMKFIHWAEFYHFRILKQKISKNINIIFFLIIFLSIIFSLVIRLVLEYSISNTVTLISDSLVISGVIWTAFGVILDDSLKKKYDKFASGIFYLDSLHKAEFMTLTSNTFLSASRFAVQGVVLVLLGTSIILIKDIKEIYENQPAHNQQKNIPTGPVNIDRKNIILI